MGKQAKIALHGRKQHLSTSIRDFYLHLSRAHDRHHFDGNGHVCYPLLHRQLRPGGPSVLDVIVINERG